MKHKLLDLKTYIHSCLSDILLIGFAILFLIILVLLSVAPDHTILLIERNIAVLVLELAICVFAIIWAIRKIRYWERKYPSDKK